MVVVEGEAEEKEKGFKEMRAANPTLSMVQLALVFSDAADLVSHHLETKDTELSTSSPF